jgi:hypothetical protein
VVRRKYRPRQGAIYVPPDRSIPSLIIKASKKVNKNNALLDITFSRILLQDNGRRRIRKIL